MHGLYEVSHIIPEVGGAIITRSDLMIAVVFMKANNLELVLAI